jgi:hypothetical protein
MNIFESENIFIYGVCGRSSSTAFQRILNSSNEVFVYGELNGIIENLVNCYYCSKNANHEGRAKDYEKLLDCFDRNKHNSFYANASKPLETIADKTKDLISEIITDPLNLSRIGKKEIEVVDRLSLLRMEQFFPNSHFIFLFRDPLKQWGSVGFLKSFWDYSKSLDSFLAEYEKNAEIYINTPLKKSFFVENTSLKDISKLNKIIKKINISNFDSELVGKSIGSTNNRKVTLKEQIKIKMSKAYRLYFKMKDLEITNHV